MVAFLLRRLGLGALVLAALSCASFCFFRWQEPPAPTASGLPGQAPTGAALLSQWWDWVRGLWGGPSWQVLVSHSFVPTSFTATGPRMVDALGHTVLLLVATLLLVLFLSVGIALVAAIRRGSLLDAVLRGLSYLAWAVPAFLLALVLQSLVNRFAGPRWTFPLAGWPGQCPAAFGLNRGFISPCAPAGHGLRYAWNVTRYLTLPALTLAIGFVGLHARYLRSALLETLDSPYITTARAKGLPERRVLVRHALRNSLITFTGALLADFGAIFGAAMAVDYVFQLGGVGAAFVNSFPRDMGYVETYRIEPIILMTAILVIASSILAELAVVWLDPRVRAAE